MHDQITTPEQEVKVCPTCGSEFFAGRKDQIYCRPDCRPSSVAKARARAFTAALGITTADLGALAELEVSCDLTRKGFQVYRALSPAAASDLIAVKDNVSHSVQVRTASPSVDGRLFFGKKGAELSEWLALYVHADHYIEYRDAKDCVTVIDPSETVQNRFCDHVNVPDV